jgi:hypothetical protein
LIATADEPPQQGPQGGPARIVQQSLARPALWSLSWQKTL